MKEQPILSFDFVTKSWKRGIPTVDVDDGLLAVTLGAAAHISIDEKRICEIDSLLPKKVTDELRASRLAQKAYRTKQDLANNVLIVCMCICIY